MAVTRKQIGVILCIQFIFAVMALILFIQYMLICDNCMMKENVPLDIFSILCLTYLMISNFQTKKIDRITRIFSLLLLASSIQLFCDMASFFTNNHPELQTVTWFLKTAYYIGDIAIVFLFGRFVCLWSGYDPVNGNCFPMPEELLQYWA